MVRFNVWKPHKYGHIVVSLFSTHTKPQYAVYNMSPYFGWARWSVIDWLQYHAGFNLLT